MVISWLSKLYRAKAAGVEMPRVKELHQQLKQRIAART